MLNLRRKTWYKKSHCDIHSSLRQRLNAVRLLSSEHSVTTLCRVLNVNRSTYYKFLHRKISKRELENRKIRNCILFLYARSKKRFGAYKMKNSLFSEYRINYSPHSFNEIISRFRSFVPLPNFFIANCCDAVLWRFGKFHFCLSPVFP